jgi:hypothetical protein
MGDEYDRKVRNTFLVALGLALVGALVGFLVATALFEGLGAPKSEVDLAGRIVGIVGGFVLPGWYLSKQG